MFSVSRHARSFSRDGGSTARHDRASTAPPQRAAQSGAPPSQARRGEGVSPRLATTGVRHHRFRRRPRFADNRSPRQRPGLADKRCLADDRFSTSRSRQTPFGRFPSSRPGARRRVARPRSRRRRRRAGSAARSGEARGRARPAGRRSLRLCAHSPYTLSSMGHRPCWTDNAPGNRMSRAHSVNPPAAHARPRR